MSTILVTGASSGMGKDTAMRLLRDGHTVYVAARRLDQMQDLKDLGAIPVKMDITQDEDILAAVRTITSVHGGVDVLVNNAGFGMYGSVEETSIEDARYQFEVNLFGLARLTQLLVPAMRERGAGKIIEAAPLFRRSRTRVRWCR
ncbi:SDR family NAD(P)-dependent oxidoreductase [Tahibacter sp.]|uniref:SDR family NAD(P)-dependent oxidoreductase n=1 Tax=Tahibacter sp. TaxID=2056211 RepID=UPI0028C3C1A0|nr:SDR family NAD(P)-dependent oxidoreductase [Tahibacter sp.]